MKGEIEGFKSLFGIQRNASQRDSSRRDGTRGSEREFVSDPDIQGVCLQTVHCRKGTTKWLWPDADEKSDGLSRLNPRCRKGTATRIEKGRLRQDQI